MENPEPYVLRSQAFCRFSGFPNVAMAYTVIDSSWGQNTHPTKININFTYYIPTSCQQTYPLPLSRSAGNLEGRRSKGFETIGAAIKSLDCG